MFDRTMNLRKMECHIGYIDNELKKQYQMQHRIYR